MNRVWLGVALLSVAAATAASQPGSAGLAALLAGHSALTAKSSRIRYGV